MRPIFAVWRASGLCAALTILPSCGSMQPASSPLGSLQQSAPAFPDRTANGGLVYAGAKHIVEVYSFPHGTYEGYFKLPGSVSGMCSDSKGNVFIAASQTVSGQDAGYLYEYAHGGNKPIAALNAPKHEIPIACSIDPTTGNLAVTLEKITDYAPSVAVYPKASGTPKVYFAKALGANPQAGYDDEGNLFATSGGSVVAKLPAGKTRFVEITLDKILGGVAHVQWDGTNIALQAFDSSKHNGEKIFERIFRLQFSGTTGKIVSTIRFHNWNQKDAGDSWIQGDEIVATPFGAIVFWAYPAGGKAVKAIHPVDHAKAITVSVETKQL
jgi:hypothetical protein